MEEIKIKIPSGWDEVTLKQYSQLADIITENPTDRLLQTISILSGVDTLLLSGVDVLDMEGLITDIDYLTEKPQSFPTGDNITLGGYRYGVVKDYNKDLTMGEMVTIETLLEQHTNGVEHIRIVASIMLRPFINSKRKPFDMEDFYKQYELMNNTPITTVLGIVDTFFFGEAKH